MTTDNRNWLALHIFYHDASRFDELLLKAIVPAMQQVFAKNWCEGWFFLRYWEGGPHIRLRLLNPHPDAEGFLKEQLSAYIAQHPSEVSLERESFYANHKLDGQDKGDLNQYPWYPNGSIQVVPYEPEYARYGGEAGIPIAEELFRYSSEVAMQAIHMSVGSMQKRMGVSLDLMMVTLFSLLRDQEAMALSLKQYAESWSFYMDSLTGVEGQAQQEYAKKRESLQTRWNRVQEIAQTTDKPSLYSFWMDKVREINEKYEDVGTFGKQDILRIFFSQIHMLNNRLGISPEQEAYLSYLGYLMLFDPIRAMEREVASTSATARLSQEVLYHESSKYLPGLVEQQRPQPVNMEQEEQAHQELLARLPRRDLPPVTELPPVNRTLTEVLRGRRSAYGKYQGTLSFAELASLLHHAAGITGELSIPRPDDTEFLMQLRAYPSGGGRYPVRLILYAQDVESLEPAFYLYDAPTHALYKMGERESFAEEIIRGSVFTYPREEAILDVYEAPLFLFFVGEIEFMKVRYGLRAYRLILAECGHLAQNIALVATALQLQTVTIGGFFDDLLNRLLRVDGQRQALFYYMPIGRAE